MCVFSYRAVLDLGTLPLPPEANPTGSQVTPAIYALVPRLPPYQPIRHLSRSKRVAVSPAARHRSLARSAVSRHVQGAHVGTLNMGQTVASRDRGGKMPAVLLRQTPVSPLAHHDRSRCLCERATG
jgi:hypothetical protein